MTDRADLDNSWNSQTNQNTCIFAVMPLILELIMKFLSPAICLVLVVLIGPTVFGQPETNNPNAPADETAKSQPAGKKSDDNTDPLLELEVKVMKSVLTQAFEKVELNDNQQQRIASIVDECVFDLVKAKNEERSQLSTEERKQYQAHFRFARLGHFTAERAKSYALAKLELPKDRQTALAVAIEKSEFQEKRLNNEIASILSKEQRKKLPMFNNERPTERHGGVILPNMKTAEDLAVVKEKLLTIDKLKILKVDEQKQLIRYEIRAGSNMYLKLKSFVEQGIEPFKDFSFDIAGGDEFAELLKPVDEPSKKEKDEGSTTKKKSETTTTSDAGSGQ